MDLFAKILENFNIKDYDQLSSDEQSTIRSWVDNVEKSQITLEDVKLGITSMRQLVEAELVNCETTGRKDLYLKARLKNLILIETVLTRPERARAALDSYVARGKSQLK